MVPLRQPPVRNDETLSGTLLGHFFGLWEVQVRGVRSGAQPPPDAYSCKLVAPYVNAQHHNNENHEAHADNSNCIVSKTDTLQLLLLGELRDFHSGWQNEESLLLLRTRQ